MVDVVLLLGSNTEDKHTIIQKTEELIDSRIGKIIRRSDLFETEPWGFRSDENFLNRALLVTSPHTPAVSMLRCLEIEKQLGRIRSSKKYESRLIDIDIVFYGDLVYHGEGLIIPHPRMHLRRFMLEPLNDIIPGFRHPVFMRSVSELLEACRDTCWVKRWKTK